MVPGWTAVTLAMRTADTSVWDMRSDSRIERQAPEVQKLMSVNTGGPWKPSSPASK